MKAMHKEMQNPRSGALSPQQLSAVEVACGRIAPLWDLNNYVAVNPFVGYSSAPIADTFRIVRDVLGAEILPSASYYRDRWRDGDIDTLDLSGAADRFGVDAETLRQQLCGELPFPARPAAECLTLTERHDRQFGTAWSDFAVRLTSRWCSTFLTDAGAYRLDLAGGDSPSAASHGLYTSWREAAVHDLSLDAAGLSGWRKFARTLPETPGAAIAVMLTEMEIDAHDLADYFYRLLGGVLGWASLLRRRSWDGSSSFPGQLLDLLAIRVCYDTGAARLALRTSRANKPSFSNAADVGPIVEDETMRLACQEALEDAYVRNLTRDITGAESAPYAGRPAVQAVFCIDTRSEVLRRHLEAQSSDISTVGFAGFFGVCLDWRDDTGSSARCPVLLKPSLGAQSLDSDSHTLEKLVKQLQSAPASSFSYVELLGAAYAGKLVLDTLGRQSSHDAAESSVRFDIGLRENTGASLKELVDVAEGIVKNTGLKFGAARLVLLCGHQSISANNSHAASLECGACGGHGGAINARAAAALLNNPAVREGLVSRETALPADTWFVAGVHTTSTDEITLLDTDIIPKTHLQDIQKLTKWLHAASEGTRRERASALGITGSAQNVSHSQKHQELLNIFKARSKDWSEVRPEWGLARNAAFIAAPRSRTKNVDLQGRAFLHDYDWTRDADDSILELILSAPMVVASWINLQYYASTVNNETFGCGAKALHNRVESIGVILGNGGDLRTGLPLQSVCSSDGVWYHEPLRLQVIVEAPVERVRAAIEAKPGVAELVRNGWVRLFALDPSRLSLVRL